MIQSRVKELLEKLGISSDHKLLVALSGGGDSMALLHLLKTMGFQCVAAHCNFHLRGDESDGDEAFVRAYCLEIGVPLHVKHFNTIDQAKEQGISIEMAARDLRYRWFWRLVETESLDFLATGHHGDDMIETFFLNLARGTGLRGLKGMQPLKGKLLRPLLGFRRETIEAYCEGHGISYRTDSTNTDTTIRRNYVRKHIIPAMNALNPSFFNTMVQNFSNITEVWEVFSGVVGELKTQMVAAEGDNVLIPIRLIASHPQRETVLFEILRPYHFNAAVVNKIVQSLEGIPGKQFFSSSHRLVRDRFNLVVVPLDVPEEDLWYIDSDVERIDSPLGLQLRVFDRESSFVFSRNSRLVHLDADLVDFPLEVRRWRSGDQFRPLGMNNFKKLSDFFVDEKFSLVQKEESWLLVTGGEIVWVVGHRIDDRFKVTPGTRRILEITMTSR